MTAFATASSVVAIIMAGAILGGVLRKRLPEHHLAEDTKDMVKVGIGFLTMLTAVVLGLIITSAKSSFDSNQYINHCEAASTIDQVSASKSDQAIACKLMIALIISFEPLINLRRQFRLNSGQCWMQIYNSICRSSRRLRPSAHAVPPVHVEPSEAIDMHDNPNIFPFPELRDEAVVAIDDFIEELYTRFENRYFAQMHRYYHDRPDPDRNNEPMPLPLDDPPF